MTTSMYSLYVGVGYTYIDVNALAHGIKSFFNVCMYVCMCVYVSMHVHVCIYVCMYVCVYVYVNMYMCVTKFSIIIKTKIQVSKLIYIMK